MMPVMKPLQRGKSYSREGVFRVMQPENEKSKRRDEQVGKDSGINIGKERCVHQESHSATARQKRKMLGNRRQKLRLGYRPLYYSWSTNFTYGCVMTDI